MARHTRVPTDDVRFSSTNWGLIAAARSEDAPQARRALADLCEAYWYPLYAYIRRRGNPPDQAQDLTQEFFARLLAHDFLTPVGPEKGKFRSYLLKCCQNFLANQRARQRAFKHGGGHLTISIDTGDAEQRYAYELSHSLTAERLFERRWVLTQLAQAVSLLREEMVKEGKEPLFLKLRPALLRNGSAAPYAEVAAELGMTEDAVKTAAGRLRTRFAALLRAEIGRTVETREEIDEEIRDLFKALQP